MNRASCSSRLSGDPIHSHGKHIIFGDVIRDEKECLLCPVSERIRQVLVLTGAFAVSPDLDVLVKLPEKGKREFGDAKFAKEVPRDKGVVNELCSAQGREILCLDKNVVSADAIYDMR